MNLSVQTVENDIWQEETTAKLKWKKAKKFQERAEFEIFAYDKINQSEGLIYIHDCTIPDIDDFSSELEK